jgi:hypothetical protein
MARPINDATITALTDNSVTSSSLMAPCPGFLQAAEFALAHPQNDIGIHLTLTSEWPIFRWGPTAPTAKVLSLLAPDGCFWPDLPSLLSHVRLNEVEYELESQINEVLEVGIRPTHLDSHMFILFRTQELYTILKRVAYRYRLPFPNARDDPDMKATAETSIKKIFHALPPLSAERWERAYQRMVRSLTPGIYELIVHLGFDGTELRSITADQESWGAAWRQRDVEVVHSAGFRKVLQSCNVTPIGWRDLPLIEMEAR